MSVIVVIDHNYTMVAASSSLVPLGKPSVYMQQLLDRRAMDRLLKGDVREFDRAVFLSPYTDVLWRFEGIRVGKACEGHLILHDERCEATPDEILSNAAATDLLGVHRTTLWRHTKANEVVAACRRKGGWSKNALTYAAESQQLPF